VLFILFYFILFYFILFYFILFYFILFYFIYFGGWKKKEKKMLQIWESEWPLKVEFPIVIPSVTKFLKWRAPPILESNEQLSRLREESRFITERAAYIDWELEKLEEEIRIGDLQSLEKNPAPSPLI